jgi:S-adenosylmethionine:tRNA ribosyltransferase-isomerase
MVLDRTSRTIQHRRFCELPSFVRDGDLLVLNDTRVLAARLFSDDGAFEYLFLEKVKSARWKCLVKPGRKIRIGTTSKIANVVLRVEEILPGGERVVSLSEDIDLYSFGSMPLPPYITRRSDHEDDLRYQTVFGRSPGAIAAPTAGLHFTREILSRLPHAFVTLHVGPGTFRSVRSADIREHQMHPEWFSISLEAAEKINHAKRIVAVGTTIVRALETAARETRPLKAVKLANHRIDAQTGETDLFICPPFRFRVVDRLVTNFHLPKSTLLMLVSAFADRQFVLDAYAEAIRERYRFYSYGDCMLIT